ncbi:MAG: P-type conjugative transfer protein VirB9 [Rickettsiales bacterium]
MNVMNHPIFSVLVLLTAIITYADSAYATREAKPIKVDHRVRTIMYQPDQVYRFTGHYRYQSSIEFAEGEEIQTISMGDSTAWMLNPSGNLLFLKPIDQDATTNMTLITNMRTYLFELHARATDNIADDNMVFVMRFLYPDDQGSGIISQYLDSVPNPDLPENRSRYNFNYTISGTDFAAPIRIFDDGEFTYFEFEDINADVPAFYWVDDLGNESLVNYRTRGDYIVIERVVKRFTLRHGPAIICVFNEKLLGGEPPKKP